ncbi:hypothetical protein [Rhodococcus jostii]|uniref:hypothetical protein n=1 Tax=Rhodococcus jostii TaxID=132919 RepID=UPI003638E89D
MSTSRKQKAEANRDVAGLAGYLQARSDGASQTESVAGLYGARAFSGAVEAERIASQLRREKLANTIGFWPRLWVRIVG